MKQFHRLFFLLLLFMVLAASGPFADENLLINADEVNYLKGQHLVEARGNVTATYKDMELSGTYLLYNTETKQMHAGEGFSLKYAGVTLEGERLDYNILSQRGTAEAVQIVYEKVTLAGKTVTLRKNFLVLKDAYFTSCDLPQPHIHISAREIVFYPQDAWLLIFWGAFWLGNVPTVPLPVYFYDFRADQSGDQNTLPYPVIGSDERQGFSAKQSIPWFSSPNLNGSFVLGYSDIQGLGIGIDGRYRLNENNQGNWHWYSVVKDRWEGGITHINSFGGKRKSLRPGLFSLMGVPPGRQFDLEFDLSIREWINNQEVSHFPKLTLNMHETELDAIPLSFKTEISAGIISEESTALMIGEAYVKQEMWYRLMETPIGTLSPGAELDYYTYGNGNMWSSCLAMLRVDKAWSDLTFNLTYYRYIYNYGASPFNFENYKFNPEDEIDTTTYLKLGDSIIGLGTAYYVPTGELKDWDYYFSLGMHCYRVTFGYRVMRNQISLGFSFD